MMCSGKWRQQDPSNCGRPAGAVPVLLYLLTAAAIATVPERPAMISLQTSDVAESDICGNIEDAHTGIDGTLEVARAPPCMPDSYATYPPLHWNSHAMCEWVYSHSFSNIMRAAVCEASLSAGSSFHLPSYPLFDYLSTCDAIALMVPCSHSCPPSHGPARLLCNRSSYNH